MFRFKPILIAKGVPYEAFLYLLDVRGRAPYGLMLDWKDGCVYVVDVPSAAHERIIGHFGSRIYDALRGAYQSRIFPFVDCRSLGIKMGERSCMPDFCLKLDCDYASPAAVDADHQVIPTIAGEVGVSEDLDHLLSKSRDYIKQLLVDIVVAVDVPLPAGCLSRSNLPDHVDLYVFIRGEPDPEPISIPLDVRFTFNLPVADLERKLDPRQRRRLTCGKFVIPVEILLRRRVVFEKYAGRFAPAPGRSLYCSQ